MSDILGQLGGVRIMPSPHHPTEFSHMETVRFAAHPLIRWLARWLPIEPYIEAEYARQKDCAAIFNGYNNTLYCSLAQADYLRRHTGAREL
ncbi:MAG: hypothetical protein GY906_24270 [bacterium]|nr:hypothetical protein [bacterium]